MPHTYTHVRFERTKRDTETYRILALRKDGEEWIGEVYANGPDGAFFATNAYSVSLPELSEIHHFMQELSQQEHKD